MKLERIKCKHFSCAWDITASSNHLVGCTGRRAVILDRELELLHTVEGLDYVYAARFSPDEGKLLLISNGNKFYILDMETKQLSKLTVRAPYNYNLEGRGCWSFDGGSVWIPVMHSKTLNSTLRRYRADDLTKFDDLLPQRYCLTDIQPLESRQTYLLVALDRSDGCEYFIYFDGGAFTVHKLAGSESMVVFDCDVDEAAGTVTLYTNKGCRRYSAEGALLEIIHPPVDMDDRIQKYALSPCGKYRLYGTKSGFYLTDAATCEVLTHVPEEYGVRNFELIAPDVIALSTWGGVKLYRIKEG